MSTTTLVWVWDNSSQCGTHLLVLLTIADHADQYGIALIEESTIARLSRIDVTDVAGYLSSLAHAGELVIASDNRPRWLLVINTGENWALCQAELTRYFKLLKPNSPEISPPLGSNPGFVYLLKSSTGHYKIGRTRAPQNRLATFGVKLPFEVEFVHLIPCDDMVMVEKQLQARFATKRINGEWFDLDSDDVAWIKTAQP